MLMFALLLLVNRAAAECNSVVTYLLPNPIGVCLNSKLGETDWSTKYYCEDGEVFEDSYASFGCEYERFRYPSSEFSNTFHCDGEACPYIVFRHWYDSRTGQCSEVDDENDSYDDEAVLFHECLFATDEQPFTCSAWSRGHGVMMRGFDDGCTTSPVRKTMTFGDSCTEVVYCDKPETASPTPAPTPAPTLAPTDPPTTSSTFTSSTTGTAIDSAQANDEKGASGMDTAAVREDESSEWVTAVVVAVSVVFVLAVVALVSFWFLRMRNKAVLGDVPETSVEVH